MKKLMGAAMLVGATVAGAGVANADEPSISGSVTLTSDYVYRGVSQTANGPAIQGSFDYTNGDFYAGVWASSVDFGSGGGVSVDVPLEIDVYAGVTPTIGPINADFGIIGYLYPGADDDTWFASGEWNYWEFKAAGSINLSEPFAVGAAAYYSPEFPGDGGEGLYIELNGAYAVSDAVTISGAFGKQEVDFTNYFTTTGAGTDSYNTWNIGGTIAVHGFEFDLRYSDTDEALTNLFGEEVGGEKFAISLTRSL